MKQSWLISLRQRRYLIFPITQKEKKLKTLFLNKTCRRFKSFKKSCQQIDLPVNRLINHNHFLLMTRWVIIKNSFKKQKFKPSPLRYKDQTSLRKDLGWLQEYQLVTREVKLQRLLILQTLVTGSHILALMIRMEEDDNLQIFLISLTIPSNIKNRSIISCKNNVLLRKTIQLALNLFKTKPKTKMIIFLVYSSFRRHMNANPQLVNVLSNNLIISHKKSMQVLKHKKLSFKIGKSLHGLDNRKEMK